MISRNSVIRAAAVLLALAPTPVNAQIDPFNAVKATVGWFDELNSQWNRILVREERQQLLRSVDRLRRSLFVLQSNSELLLGSIPDSNPDVVEREELTRQLADLLENLEALKQSLRGLGEEIGARDAKSAAWVVETMVVRRDTIQIMGLALRHPEDPGRWKPKEFREMIKKGLANITEAQNAVTRFRSRLAAQHCTAGGCPAR